MEKAKKFCPNCGAELKSDADFCPNCGFKLSKKTDKQSQVPKTEKKDAPISASEKKQEIPESPRSSKAQVFCPNCGHPLKPGAEFCPNCGYNVRTKQTPQKKILLSLLHREVHNRDHISHFPRKLKLLFQL